MQSSSKRREGNHPRTTLVSKILNSRQKKSLEAANHYILIEPNNNKIDFFCQRIDWFPIGKFTNFRNTGWGHAAPHSFTILVLAPRAFRRSRKSHRIRALIAIKRSALTYISSALIKTSKSSAFKIVAVMSPILRQPLFKLLQSGQSQFSNCNARHSILAPEAF